MSSNLQLSVLLLLFSIFIHNTSSIHFHSECRESLSRGRETVERVSTHLADKEVRRLKNLLESAKKLIHSRKEHEVSLTEDVQNMMKLGDEPPCPMPNDTMFTDSTTATTTLQQSSTSSNDQTTATEQSSTSSSASESTTQPNTQSSSTDSSTTSNMGSTETVNPPSFRAPKIYAERHEDDPFHWYMSTLHHFLSREEHVCDRGQIRSFEDITEDHLFGFFSTLATSHPGPVCSLCHRFVEQLQDKIFKPISFLIRDDMYHMDQVLYSHVPFARDICTAIAPGCHDDYAIKVGNLTESVVCLECTACMAVTNVVQHKFLLQRKIVDQVYTFLRGNIFHNLCADFCHSFYGNNITIFPNGFTYDGCQAYMKNKYYQAIEVATVILRPERLCTLELQWCELNEQPNAIHCLREMCQEYFHDTPQTRWLCSQIPDRPEQADKFLNIHKTKIYKEKKDYHKEFESRSLHDEL